MLRYTNRYSVSDLELLDVSQFHTIKFGIVTTKDSETIVESKEELGRWREEEL